MYLFNFNIKAYKGSMFVFKLCLKNQIRKKKLLKITQNYLNLKRTKKIKMKDFLQIGAKFQSTFFYCNYFLK